MKHSLNPVGPQMISGIFALFNRKHYIYTASGVKLRTKHYTASGGTTTTTEYIDNKVYVNGALNKILTEGGYIAKEGAAYNRYYYAKDHLGNNRVVLNASGGVVQATNYYPFGLSFAEAPARSDQGVQPYKYNGKELDRMYGVDTYDYEARMYSPAIGRFMTMDPLSEKYYSVSPYAYCGNNPVNRIDPDGMEWRTKEDEEYARYLSQAMTNRMNSEQKSLDKLNAKIVQNQEKGKDVSKDQAKAAGMQANIDNLQTGISELTAMGDTKDQIFTYSKIGGNVGGAEIKDDGIVSMEISGNGSIANGIHESSHGYDLWKNGRPTEKTAIAGEVKAYGRQFSFDKSSVPISDFGRANSLSDINHRWVLGINNAGDYLYIRFVYPNRNPQDILKLIK